MTQMPSKCITCKNGLISLAHIIFCCFNQEKKVTDWHDFLSFLFLCGEVETYSIENQQSLFHFLPTGKSKLNLKIRKKVPKSTKWLKGG